MVRPGRCAATAALVFRRRDPGKGPKLLRDWRAMQRIRRMAVRSAAKRLSTDCYRRAIIGPAMASFTSRNDTPYLPRGRWHGYWIEVSSRSQWPAAISGLRPVSGLQTVAIAQLGAAAGEARDDRRCNPDARASRSLRLYSVAGAQRLCRAGVVHRCNARSLRHSLAGCRTSPRAGRGVREPPRVLKAPSRAATLYRSRCENSAAASHGGRLRARA